MIRLVKDLRGNIRLIISFRNTGIWRVFMLYRAKKRKEISTGEYILSCMK